jgi:hypothetical protein
LSDLRCGTRFGKCRPLTRNVCEMLDLSGRSARAGCGIRVFQGHLGQLQLRRSQGAHARCAARALDCRVRLVESRMRGRHGTADQERGQEASNRG